MTVEQMRRLLACIEAYSEAVAHQDPLRFHEGRRLDRAAEEARIELCAAFGVNPGQLLPFSRT